VPTVLALVSRPESRAYVGRAVRPYGGVRFCNVVAQLWAELVVGDVVAVVAEPFDADERSTAPPIAELRRVLPTMPVIVWSQDSNASKRGNGLAPFGEGGPNTAFAADLPATLAAVVPTARVQNPTRVVLDAVDGVNPALPPLADAYLRHVIRQARAGLRVRDALAALDPSKRRSLDRQLVNARVPTAQALVGWSLALHATWYWSIPTQTFESVATLLGFSDAKALRGIVTNRVGAPRDLMRRGGFHDVLARFIRLLHGDWSGERTRRRGTSTP
jgi:hypothetical protein